VTAEEFDFGKKSMGTEGSVPDICPACKKRTSDYGWEIIFDTNEWLCKRPKCLMRIRIDISNLGG